MPARQSDTVRGARFVDVELQRKDLLHRRRRVRDVSAMKGLHPASVRLSCRERLLNAEPPPDSAGHTPPAGWFVNLFTERE